MADSGVDEEQAWAGLAAHQVAAATGHGVKRLLARGTRGAALRQARWMMFYLANTSLGWSQEQVGRVYGVSRRQVGRACQAIEDDRDDPLVDAVMAALDRGLREVVEARRAGGGR